jgi:hypothetical protein
MDIAFAVSQCSRFCADPKGEHGKAVTWIELATRAPSTLHAMKVFTSMFTPTVLEIWDKDNADWDKDTARSRAGYIITYAGCPVYWQSKLITEIALSTTEAEYVAASEALRSVIPMIRLMDEL